MPTAADATAQAAAAAADVLQDIGQGEAYVVNLKTLVDAYLDLSVKGARDAQALALRVANNAISHDQDLQKLSLLALSNAVNQSNVVNGQMLSHRDLSADRQWNVDAETVQAVVAAVLTQMAAKQASDEG